MELDAASFDVLTFDCYGTLVDWADGLTSALQPILNNHDVEVDDEELFRLYGQFEKDVQSGGYMTYQEVLRSAGRRLGDHFGFTPTNAELERVADSVGRWPVFDDTNTALGRLGEHFRLAVVSNVDDALFHETARQFTVSFDEVITSEQVGAYKPALTPFEAAFTHLGVPPNRLLHVAQSVYHDLNPAGRLGLSCVWVQRYGTRFDPTTPQTEPVRTVPDLASLADLLLDGS